MSDEKKTEETASVEKTTVWEGAAVDSILAM